MVVLLLRIQVLQILVIQTVLQVGEILQVVLDVVELPVGGLSRSGGASDSRLAHCFLGVLVSSWFEFLLDL